MINKVHLSQLCPSEIYSERERERERVMDAIIATLNARANLVTKGIGSRNRSSSGFWGENTRGSLNIRFCSTPRKSLKATTFKPGFAQAVYTPDVNKEPQVIITTCKTFSDACIPASFSIHSRL